MALVLVQYDFEYTAKDGRLVSIKPNENYILISKTTDHWWHVRKDQCSRPFYVPAQYVKEISEDPKDLDSPESVDNTAAQCGLKEMCSFSMFGFSEDLQDSSPCEARKGETTSSFEVHSSTGGSSNSDPLESGTSQMDAKLQHVPKTQNRQWSKIPLQDDETKQTPYFLHDDMDFPSPPNLPVLDSIQEENIPEADNLSELPEPDLNESLTFEQHRAAEKISYTDANTKVEDENLRTAVYVNVAQLRQSISESPPSAPSSCSPSYLDPEGWEVHVDQESGQEYYYHPTTGQTTWDNPFLDSPVDPEPLLAEEPHFPSPPLSPALCPPISSPTPVWTSDWEQLVDETSGRPYFYNPMSGETSWEPPEQLSPYSPLMEPMSVHRFHEDGLPPLPKEDYPQEDYEDTDEPEELLAAGPPTLPKEYLLSHVGRTIIPRANLDRSTPHGWTLTVDPNGTWVFTNEHSPEQWIKSVDDQGQIYYYLRDGSRSLWNLPEAPSAPGRSRLENGIETIKNWRHNMGPAQLSPTQDEGRFVPTHRRNTSDYSSDSSSTGNSPDMHHNMQNLEKAGILNKTKVSENGKKVRKNWTNTWTVLHGGVLTFHKDPKSAVTGASNKTNQIVPEFTLDLKGAMINWASKEKSSKKNVLELKTKNGVEFLIQYDTESIISDWHKVLTDTIRQLDYQDNPSEEEDGDLYDKITSPDVAREDKFGSGGDKRRSSRPSVTHSSSSVGDTDPKRVRTKLMKFLMKRPTLQSVKEKGYIRDNVFGCHLAALCAQERTTVPCFVEKCIRAVEKRGLDIDGLYRVSGNLAVIQKLRYKADHEELDLEDGQWEDVHVITGALKLFFRELPEPLFPYSHFNKFITAIRIPDYGTKLSCMYELVKSLPAANHDTMQLLFGHLRRVIQYGDDNRMTVQNVAIVFGPTLLRPETSESANITMYMVFQNQIVEFILNEYDHLF